MSRLHSRWTEMDCQCTEIPMIAMPLRPLHDGARTEGIRRPSPTTASPSYRPARRRRIRVILPYVILLILGVSKIASAETPEWPPEWCGERSRRSTTKDGSDAESHAQRFSRRQLRQIAMAAPAKGAETSSISSEVDRLLRRGSSKQRGANKRGGRGSNKNNRGRKKKRRGSKNNTGGRNKKRRGGNNRPAAADRNKQKGRAANQAKRKRNAAKRAKQPSRAKASNSRGNQNKTAAAKKNKARAKGRYNGDPGGKNYKKMANSGSRGNNKAAGGDPSSDAAQKTVMKRLRGYYPIPGAGKCVQDNRYPDYMGADKEHYFSPVLNQCCRRHFRGSAAECVAESSRPDRKIPPGGDRGWGSGSPPGGSWGAGSSAPGGAWQKPWQPKPPPCDPSLPGFPQTGCDVIIEIELPPTVATYEPTYIPTDFPTFIETPYPTDNPTSLSPTLAPNTYYPTYSATTLTPTTAAPTYAPTYNPTYAPTYNPTYSPTGKPTYIPTEIPTQFPTVFPTQTPTQFPTSIPTYIPTMAPSTPIPTIAPSTPMPTMMPTTPLPTGLPTLIPTLAPTTEDTPIPTLLEPTQIPTLLPTQQPASGEQPFAPTLLPTAEPTILPTTLPTILPTILALPTAEPTILPTLLPSLLPTISPSDPPTAGEPPTFFPTAEPSAFPTTGEPPTFFPSITPTTAPTILPSNLNQDPTLNPTISPTLAPSQAGGIQGLFYWGAVESIGEELDVDIVTPVEAEELVIDASAGTDYSLLVLADGRAACGGVIVSIVDYTGHFGINTVDLEVGLVELLIITTVVNLDGEEVPAPDFIRAVAGVETSDGNGEMHSLLIDEDGNVFTFGNNDQGQLCLGDESNRELPTQVDLSSPAISAAIGRDFTIILTEDGEVFGCGSNVVGQLGLGPDIISVNELTIIDDIGDNVRDIAAGFEFSMFLAESGVYVTGQNEFGQLCQETGGDLIDFPEVIEASTGDISESIVDIAAGRESSYIVFEDGSAIACGRNQFGQLGDDSTDDSIGTQVLVTEEIDLVGAGPSSSSAFFVCICDRILFAVGDNSNGQLGIGNTDPTAIPTEVDFDVNVILTGISTSYTHTMSW